MSEVRVKYLSRWIAVISGAVIAMLLVLATIWQLLPPHKISSSMPQVSTHQIPLPEASASAAEHS